MSKRIIIVGNLAEKCDRNELLDKLSKLNNDIEWDWLKPDNEQCLLPNRPLSRLIHGIRSGEYGDNLTVIKLDRIHGRHANQIYKLIADPILPPREITNIDELVTWITNEAGIFDRQIIELPIIEITLFAILSKLVGNKSWNKDSHGHNWTQQADLLGQAPVNRRDMPQVAAGAEHILNQCSGNLLLCKGGSQGKTPLGWGINLNYLPAVKRSLLNHSLDPLREENDLQDMMTHIDNNADDLLQLDERIVSERVLSICREQQR